MLNQLCLYCRESSHVISQCQSSLPHPWENSCTSQVLSLIYTNSSPYLNLVLINTGTAGNFIDITLACHLNLPMQQVKPLLHIHVLDRSLMGDGSITQCIKPILLQLGLLYHELIQLFVVKSSHNPLVLGHPWLCNHNPHILWHMGEITAWNATGITTCLHLPILTTSGRNSPQGDSHFPQYNNILDDFSKTNPCKLSPHCPWDCAVDLLPGSTLTKSYVYPITLAEFQGPVC